MNSWIMADYTFGMLDSFLMFYFVDKFLTRRKVNIKQIVLVILIQAAVNYYINQKIGIGNLVALMIMVSTTAIFLSSIFEAKFFHIVFLIVLGVILISIVEILVMILMMFITNLDAPIFFANNLYRIIGGFTSKIIIYLVIKQLLEKIKFKITKHFHKAQIYQLILVLVLNIIIIFLAIWFYKNTNVIRGSEKKFIVILSIGIIIFTMVVLDIIKKIIVYIGKEAEWNIKEREYKRQAFYIKNMDDMLKNLRAQRHDFNHHISCIYGLISIEKYEQAKEYIKKLTKETNEYNEIINTDNPILTSLLNVKITKAKKNKIKVSTNIDINKKLFIEYIDLSIIIGNLLDNSIEACEKISECKRYIEINIYTKMNNLIIKILNSKEDVKLIEKINKERFTTKEDTENHGFGLKNIRQIVEKYGGVIKIEDEKNLFKVNIAIPIISDP